MFKTSKTTSLLVPVLVLSLLFFVYRKIASSRQAPPVSVPEAPEHGVDRELAPAPVILSPDEIPERGTTKPAIGAPLEARAEKPAIIDADPVAPWPIPTELRSQTTVPNPTPLAFPLPDKG